MQESLTEPALALGAQNPAPRRIPGNERQGHVHADGQQQRLPRHGQPPDAEQEVAQHAVQNQHGQRVDGDHDQRQPVVAFGQIPPHQHHGGTRRDAQQDAAGQITAPQRHFEHSDPADFDDGSRTVGGADRQVETERQLHVVHRGRADQIEEDAAQKEDRDAVHGERLDRPVDEQGEADRPAASAGADHLGEVDLDHDRVHHEEEAHRDRDRDDRRVVHVQRQAVQIAGHARHRAAETDAGRNAQEHPQRQITLEGAQPLRRRQRRGFRGHVDGSSPGGGGEKFFAPTGPVVRGGGAPAESLRP